MLTWLVSARLFLRAVRARALVATAAGACLADHGEMILTDSSGGPSAAVLQARLRQVRTARFPDAHVRRRFVEVEIATLPLSRTAARGSRTRAGASGTGPRIARRVVRALGTW